MNKERMKKKLAAVVAINELSEMFKGYSTFKVNSLKKHVSNLENYQDYLEEVLNSLKFLNMAKSTLKRVVSRISKHDLKEEEENLSEALVLIGSENSFCGPYNSNVVEESLKQIKSNPKIKFIYYVGKRIGDILKFRKDESHNFELVPIDSFLHEDTINKCTELIRKTIITDFFQKKFSKISLLHIISEEESNVSRIVNVNLLPIEINLDKKYRKNIISEFDMISKKQAKILLKREQFYLEEEPEKIIDLLVDWYLFFGIASSLTHALYTENFFRMISTNKIHKMSSDSIVSLNHEHTNSIKEESTRQIVEININSKANL